MNGRSWTELAETLHGGLAIIDGDRTLRALNKQFATWFGLDLDAGGGWIAADYLPALRSSDPRGLGPVVAGGRSVSAEERPVGLDGVARRLKVTVVGCADLSPSIHAVVFAEDVTATSEAIAARRDAVLGLTGAEEDEHRRLSREIHDGPVQLLTALTLRLRDHPGSHELATTVTAVADELREVLATFAPVEQAPDPAETIERWLAPFLAGSAIRLTIDGERAGAPPPALTQTIFVFLYDLIRVLRYLGGRRTVNATIEPENGGHRLCIELTPADGRAILRRRVAAKVRAMTDYAQSLGGTFETSMVAEDARLVSIWLPPVDEPRTAPARDAATPSPTHTDAPCTDGSRSVRDVPIGELADTLWERIFRRAPVPLLEYDAAFTITAANPAYLEMSGLPPAAGHKLIGRTLFNAFPPDEVDRLARAIPDVLAGRPVRIDHHRADANGEVIFVQVAARPRFDSHGAFAGLLASPDDTSDLLFLQRLHESAMADFNLARRQAIEQFVDHLRGPLDALQDVIERLRVVETASPRAEALHHVRVGLEGSIPRIRNAVDLMTAPAAVSGDIGELIRESLSSVLVGVELEFVDSVGRPLPPAQLDTCFRIAREAVNNAVVHGGASHVVVRTGRVDDGVVLEVRDDGSGIDTDLDISANGHLGLRSMFERAREQRGTCEIAPAPGRGAVLRAWLPLGEGAHAAPLHPTLVG